MYPLATLLTPGGRDGFAGVSATTSGGSSGLDSSVATSLSGTLGTSHVSFWSNGEPPPSGRWSSGPVKGGAAISRSRETLAFSCAARNGNSMGAPCSRVISLMRCTLTTVPGVSAALLKSSRDAARMSPFHLPPGRIWYPRNTPGMARGPNFGFFSWTGLGRKSILAPNGTRRPLKCPFLCR